MKKIKNWISNNIFLIVTIAMFFISIRIAVFVMLPILIILFIYDIRSQQMAKSPKEIAIRQFNNKKEIELTYIAGIDDFEYGKPAILRVNEDYSFSIIQNKKSFIKHIETIYYLKFFDYELTPENEDYEPEKDKEYVIFRMRNLKEFMFRLDHPYSHFILSKFMEQYKINEKDREIAI